MANQFNVLDGSPVDRDLGQPGITAPMLALGAYTNVTMVANQAYLARFVPSRNMTIAKISFILSTAAGADDAVDVGIFSSDLTTLLVSKGATTGVLNTAAGRKEITVASTALVAGTVYYAALSCGTLGGTAAVIQGTAINTANNAILFGSAVPNITQAQKATAHPLATGTIGTPTVNLNTVILGIRES